MTLTKPQAMARRCYRDLSSECVADMCMAWRWSRPPTDARPKSLYSKATGKQVSGTTNDDADWRLDDPTQPAPERTGYCGMAGKPEDD